VVTGCNGSRISLHAWIDGCLCYLLKRLTRIIGRDNAGISGGRGEGIEKWVIIAISLNLLTESLLDGWTGNSYDGL